MRSLKIAKYYTLKLPATEQS